MIHNKAHGHANVPFWSRLLLQTKRAGSCLLLQKKPASADASKGFGYQLRFEGRLYSAQKLIVQKILGKELPPGVCVVMKCGDRACVNPAHFTLCSHAMHSRKNIMKPGPETQEAIRSGEELTIGLKKLLSAGVSIGSLARDESKEN